MMKWKANNKCSLQQIQEREAVRDLLQERALYKSGSVTEIFQESLIVLGLYRSYFNL